VGPQPAHAGFHWRIWAAEAAGTGLMVLAILAAAALALGEGSPLAEALPNQSSRFLALGLLVGPCISLIAISPIGRLSGAHINPAVTLGFWALGRMSRHDLIGYMAAQLAGGLAGALAARLLVPQRALDSIGGAVTHPSVPAATAFALEAGMTALLLGAVLAFLASPRLARLTPVAVAPLIAAIIWLGSPWTGASLNPARSEGPAIAFGDLGDLWLYFVAPAAGALVLTALWRGRRPLTAKLFHDPWYPCSMRTELPAMPCNAKAVARH
jgi:aquaporin Z